MHIIFVVLSVGEIGGYMSTYSQLLYHIVFSTKGRMRTLNLKKRDEILSYMCGFLRNNNTHVFRINMTDDHVHIFCSIHQSECISSLIKGLKIATGKWMKSQNISPDFHGWQIGYGIFTVNWNDRQKLIEYIKNQQEHHKHTDSLAEFKKLLDEFGIDYKDAYLE